MEEYQCVNADRREWQEGLLHEANPCEEERDDCWRRAFYTSGTATARGRYRKEHREKGPLCLLDRGQTGIKHSTERTSATLRRSGEAEDGKDCLIFIEMIDAWMPPLESSF